MRKLACCLNGTKSSVHRHLRAQKQRNQHPESFFWETEAGSAWLRLLVFAVLYLFDLSSGYLLLEDISDDRRFESWHAKTSPRLEALGIEVSHAISDRAKALIKLAVTGFEVILVQTFFMPSKT